MKLAKTSFYTSKLSDFKVPTNSLNLTFFQPSKLTPPADETGFKRGGNETETKRERLKRALATR